MFYQPSPRPSTDLNGKSGVAWCYLLLLQMARFPDAIFRPGRWIGWRVSLVRDGVSYVLLMLLLLLLLLGSGEIVGAW